MVPLFPRRKLRTAIFALSLPLIMYIVIHLYYTTQDSNQGKPFRQKQQVNLKKNMTLNKIREQVYCQVKSPWTEKAVKHKTTSKMKDWSLKQRRHCPAFGLRNVSSERLQVNLHCEKDESYMTTTKQNISHNIQQIHFKQQCLVDVIDKCCYDGNTVPNVAHFIWYSKNVFGFFHHLTMTSILRFMEPCLILIHGPYTPSGNYWDDIISTTPNVIHVYRQIPMTIYGHSFAFKEHISDVMRIEALQEYGGVYFDLDEVLLRPIDRLRKYDYTQGHEMHYTLGSQLILAKKNATFLTYWHRGYRDDYKKDWAYNALWVPWLIAKRHPKLIHVEGFNFSRPSWKDVDMIFKMNYDWSTNYGMHLYIRWYKQSINAEIIRTLNTTIGSVSRHILFGDKELCIK